MPDIVYRLPLLLREECIPDGVVEVIGRVYGHLLALDMNDESLDRLLRFIITTSHHGVCAPRRLPLPALRLTYHCWQT